MPLRFRTARALAAALVASVALAAPAFAQDSSLFSELRWRCIGPHRGGRTVAAAGVPQSRGLFYIGVNNGGVWRTTDYGRTWRPIFDDQPTQSIGAIAVAPSRPATIYVGSGEGLQRPDLSVGDGMYRSDDAGATWRHLGLRDGRQIPAIAVDPRDPERVFVAVLGHPYGPNRERGVYRSRDGGRTWECVLHTDDDTGAMDVVLDPANPRVVYAVLWAARQAPWENGWSLSAKNGLHKSVDGGTTWRRIGAGLPTGDEGLGRIGIGMCPSDPKRVYAITSGSKTGGLYRSDDSGEHFRLVNADERLCERNGDFDEVKADPTNADVVYVGNVVAWKSTDGGRTFEAFRGAPGGDDYHRFWIDPNDPRVILLAGDQGAVITVNGGESWSSWYNQPTAQFFHVATDFDFPYHVYGGQQESGSAGVASRGRDGAITLREWHPVGVEEYGYVAPDPVHSHYVFGGKITRYDRRTGDVKNVSPDPMRRQPLRWVRTMPVVWHPAQAHELLLGANVVFSSLDDGEHWTTISPDLTRESYETPPNMGAFAALDGEKGRHRGVVYTIAGSPRSPALIWAGTDDGLVHVTHDHGRTWSNVTPPALTPWSKVSMLEASYADSNVAYAAINRFRLDDVAPHVWRTRDGGRTWAEIVTGLPPDVVVNAVREDPVVPSLLYAATERGVFVSFDAGERWQSLRNNLPATSVRDLVVKDADLVIGTHGRSFWILDDVSPLRQAAASSAARAAAEVFLCKPALATRVRWNRNTDTPSPPDEPAGQNPPDGAVLDYVLARDARGPVTLELFDAKGRLVRRYSSADSVHAVATADQTPGYWMREERALSAKAGAHRFVWDLREGPPPSDDRAWGMAAIEHDTPAEPRGPWVLPGTYTVRFTVDDRAYEQPLVVRMDPRSPAGAEALATQHALSLALLTTWRNDAALAARVRTLRARVTGTDAASDSLRRDLAALEGRGGGPWWARGGGGRDCAALATDCSRAFDQIQRADDAPTAALATAAPEAERALAALLERERALLARARALGVKP
ncbi:MAG: glycoside hydrolase [Candidatus Eisenbacteria bacterium]|uniref:Glycoside hydrolase n=1 Tax=Eiseniibacteriota bacterium TaxID=2212470 RepID=A0A933SEE2_UNCEI|nr:glycoside hydrolase [Candidatus Eisenbacteria bacterium]